MYKHDVLLQIPKTMIKILKIIRPIAKRQGQTQINGDTFREVFQKINNLLKSTFYVQ